MHPLGQIAAFNKAYAVASITVLTRLEYPYSVSISLILLHKFFKPVVGGSPYVVCLRNVLEWVHLHDIPVVVVQTMKKGFL